MDFQSRNLVVPRGKVLFARYLPGTQNPGPFKELGNCPEFTLTRETSKLSHYSSQRGIKNLDEEITTDSTMEGSLSTDDMRATNWALWFMSTVQTVTQASITGGTEQFTVQKGDIVQLGRSALNPIGARNVTVTSVAPTTTGTAYVAGTDYLVDAVRGIVEVLPTGAIVEGASITVTYTAATATAQRIAMGETEAEGELKFLAFNPVGPNRDITLPRARLSPNGDLSMLTDPENPDWQTIGLSISALKKGDLALAYADGQPVVV